jgi:peroxiredoxin
MKKIMRLLFIITFTLNHCISYAYNIEVKINGLSNKNIFLGYHFGPKQYVLDTTTISNKGVAVFAKKDSLPGGIYFIVLPDKRYFEVLIDKNNQNFAVETDTLDFVNNTKFKNSPENEAFYKYLKSAVEEQKQMSQLQSQYSASKTKADSLLYEKQIIATNTLIQQKREALINNAPTSFLATLLKLMKEPQVPTPTPILPNGRPDSTFAYNYFKAHFFDDINIYDTRTLRTPILENKIDYYFDKLVIPTPDSLNSEVDRILTKTKNTPEMFKYLLWHFTYKAESSKIMGMDAHFLHLAENYYMKGLAPWADSASLAKITTKAFKLSNNLIGQQAFNLNIEDTNDVKVNMSLINAPYTVLVFWDPSCGHCKTEVPQLDSVYRTDLKKMGAVIYAVKSDGDNGEWKKFIKEKQLNGWLHVYDKNRNSNFHYYYGVDTTPMIFVLDKRKKIIAKKLDPIGLVGFLKKHKEITQDQTK